MKVTAICLQDDILEKYEIIGCEFEESIFAHSPEYLTVNFDLHDSLFSLDKSLEYFYKDLYNGTNKTFILISENADGTCKLFHGVFIRDFSYDGYNTIKLDIDGHFYEDVKNINNNYKIGYKWFDREKKQFITDEEVINLLNMMI